MAASERAAPLADLSGDGSNYKFGLTIRLGTPAVLLIVCLIVVMVGLGVAVGVTVNRNMITTANALADVKREGARMAKEHEETLDAVRANTVATDLAKYNAQEVRVQADTNKALLTALHARGCYREDQ